MGASSRSKIIKRVFFHITIVWTVLLVALVVWDIKELKGRNTDNFVSQARSFYKLVVTTRQWNALHGRVYVPATVTTRPNPYLDPAGREIIGTDGEVLTLINPAYMTRQLSELSRQKDGLQFNLTSLNPIRPENVPTEWEASLLKGFGKKSTEKYYWSGEQEGGKKFFRYMGVLWVKKDCLTCHAFQGYKEGDVRGGLSITIPADQAWAQQKKDIVFICLTHFILWLLGLAGSYVSYRLIRSGADERESLLKKLYLSLGEIKILRGLLPICASCKKIRNDDGAWEVIENYLRDHSEAEFSHGICPDCLKKLYPEHADKILANKHR